MWICLLMIVKIWNQHLHLVFLEEKDRSNESICTIMRRPCSSRSFDQLSNIPCNAFHIEHRERFWLFCERWKVADPQPGRSIIYLLWLFTMGLWIRGQLCRCYVTSVVVDAVKGNPAVSFFVLPHPRQFLPIRPQTASLLQKKCLLLTICVA